MFSNLPESINFKEDNKKKVISLAFISILWVLSFSTSTVANIIFYDAKLEEQLQFLCMCAEPPPPPPPPPNYYTASELLWASQLNKHKIHHNCIHIDELVPYIEVVEFDTTLENSSQPIEQSEDIILGNAINKIAPLYPSIARENRVSGNVEINIIIDEKGNVINAKVVNGDRLLQQAALKAARQWKFNPTLLNGIPVKIQGILTFRFKL